MMRSLDNLTDSLTEKIGVPRWLLRTAIGANKVESVLNDLNDFKSIDQFARDYFEHQSIGLKVQNLDQVPKTGACVVAANHPTGWVEVMALLGLMREIRQDVKLLGNFILAELEGWDPYVIPVYLSKEDDRKAFKSMQEQLENEGLILIFPAGRTSFKQQGTIAEQPWKGSFIKAAHNANQVLEDRGSAPVSIVPAKVDAQASDFFYWLQNHTQPPRPELSDFWLFREALKMRGKNMGIDFLSPHQAPADPKNIQTLTESIQRSVEQF